MRKDVEIYQKNGNVCVSVGKEIVFERPKTEQTVSIAEEFAMRFVKFGKVDGDSYIPEDEIKEETK